MTHLPFRNLIGRRRSVLIATASIMLLSPYAIGSGPASAQPAPPLCGLKITGVEVTQSAQWFRDTNNIDNTIPLIDTRATTARVYFEQDPPLCPEITIDGWVRADIASGPSTGWNMVQSIADREAVVPQTGSDRKIEETTLQFSFVPNFYVRHLPNGGTLNLHVCASVVPNATTLMMRGHAPSRRNDTMTSMTECVDRQVSFAAACGLDIRAIPVNLTNGNPAPGLPDDMYKLSIKERAAATVMAALPVPMAPQRFRYRMSSQKAFPWASLIPDQYKQRDLACAIENFVLTVEDPVPNAMVGWFDDAGQTSSRGAWCSAAYFGPYQGSDKRSGMVASDRDASFQRTLAHELGHEFLGATHQGGILDMVGWDVYNRLAFPLPTCLAGGSGCHVRMTKGGVGQFADPVSGQLPLMYIQQDTATTWIKGTQYIDIRNQLSQRLDCDDFTRIPPRRSMRSLLINRQSDLSWVIHPTFEITSSAELSPEILGGNAELRIVNDTNNVLYSTSFVITDTTISSITAVADAVTDTSRIQWLVNGLLEDELVRSPYPPSVEITVPLSGTAVIDNSTIQWSASDLDEDTLISMVQYSPDAGVHWLPIEAFVSGESAIINTEELPAGQNARIRVATTDGVSTSYDTIHVHLDDDKFPRIGILSPNPNEIYRQGSNIQLIGSADDLEDGQIESDHMIWVSSIDGYLGSGAELNIATLTPGIHTISLVAYDLNYHSTTSSVVIEVQ